MILYVIVPPFLYMAVDIQLEAWCWLTAGVDPAPLLRDGKFPALWRSVDGWEWMSQPQNQSLGYLDLKIIKYFMFGFLLAKNLGHDSFCTLCMNGNPAWSSIEFLCGCYFVQG